MSNDAAKELRARLRAEARAINERNRVPGDLYYREPVPQPEQPTLTEAEAQLVIGAIPLQALSGEAGPEGSLCSHSDKEWRLSDVNPTDVKCDHDYIAIATTRKHAKRIVTDHARAALVPGLVAALRLSLLERVEMNGRCDHEPNISEDCFQCHLRRLIATARKAGVE